MRTYLPFMAAVLCAIPLFGQSSASDAKLNVAAFDKGVSGDWVGVLEYRDYKEPPSSTKRVSLPTWLHITADGDHETWHYIYDDGPGKVVDETEVLAADSSGTTVSLADNGKPAQVYRVESYTERTGNSRVQLTTLGTDAGKPAELRMTLTVRANLLSVMQEARPASSTEPFAFRHEYKMVRKDPAAVTAAR